MNGSMADTAPRGGIVTRKRRRGRGKLRSESQISPSRVACVGYGWMGRERGEKSEYLCTTRPCPRSHASSNLATRPLPAARLSITTVASLLGAIDGAVRGGKGKSKDDGSSLREKIMT
jgi:hypothetical protein